jgi:hypothetical protein
MRLAAREADQDAEQCSAAPLRTPSRPWSPSAFGRPGTPHSASNASELFRVDGLNHEECLNGLSRRSSFQHAQITASYLRPG